jgi:hypothetical protein
VPELVDDSTIGNDEILWRRVSPEQIQPTEGTDPPAPPSLAFKSNAVLISVNRASLSTVEATLQGYPKHSLLQVTAGSVRTAGCIVAGQPIEGNPAHAFIVGNGSNGRLKGSEYKAIARSASWVVYKPGTLAS